MRYILSGTPRNRERAQKTRLRLSVTTAVAMANYTTPANPYTHPRQFQTNSRSVARPSLRPNAAAGDSRPLRSGFASGYASATAGVSMAANASFFACWGLFVCLRLRLSHMLVCLNAVSASVSQCVSAFACVRSSNESCVWLEWCGTPGGHSPPPRHGILTVIDLFTAPAPIAAP